jgi:WD40 repeat protein
VWNADGSGAPVFLEGHEGPVWSAAFGPDGTHIVTASADRVVRLWRLWPLAWPELLEDLRRRTNACLTVPHRTRHLQETAERARDRYEECERSFSRR